MDSTTAGPPDAVLLAFGVADDATVLPGGKGATWRAGQLVFKAVDLLEETLWRAEVLASLADSSQFRVARPVAALDGKWVVQGWEARQFVPGETNVRRQDDVLRAGIAFHAAIPGLAQPPGAEPAAERPVRAGRGAARGRRRAAARARAAGAAQAPAGGVPDRGRHLWRRRNPHPRKPADGTFVAVGAASGLGSALLGSVGPLTAPFFLAYGLSRAAHIGTEAAAALTMHLAKVAAAGDLLTARVLLLGAALTSATLAGAWVGIGLLAAGALFLLGR